MDVVYHSSDSFGVVSAVSIISLLENNKNVDAITIYYIERGMTENTKQRIRKIVNDYQRKIEFIKMPNWSQRFGINLKSCKEGWLGFGYNRLFISELLPENIDRVLYLDSDTLVEEDLSDLWGIDLDEYYMAAVDDCLSESYNEIVEITDKSVYCNAGVLLINLKKWRDEKIIDRFIDYIVERQGYFAFNEQSILNSIFAEKIFVLPCKYNTTSLVYLFSYDELMKLRKPAHYSYSEEEFIDAKKNSVITHFTGCFYIRRRPWIVNSDHPYSNAYDRYYAMTPWKYEPYMNDNRNLMSKIGTIFSHIIPRKIMIYLVSFMYTNIRVKRLKKQLISERKG